MKKITLMLGLILGLALLSNAATINWNTGTARLVNSDGSIIDQTGLLAVAAAGDFVLVSTADGTTVGNSTATLNTTTTAKAGRLAGGVETIEGTWDVGDTFVMMYQSAGTLYEVRYVGDLSLNTYTVSNNHLLDPPLNPDAYVIEADNFYIVPEPTSLALLALGIAALGLRRRRS